MDSEEDPWRLALNHRCDEAVAIYDSRLKRDKVNHVTQAGRASTLMVCRRLPEALEAFRLAAEIEHGILGEHSAGYALSIATVLWALDQKKEAISTFTNVVESLRSGTIRYADAAGGASPGLLLLYAAATLSDQAMIDEAVGYLSWLAGKGRIVNWPGPVVLFVLKRLSEDELLTAGFRSNDLSAIWNKAASDLGCRRNLAKALFYMALRRRMEGDIIKADEFLEMCAGLENPILENEWYLARIEVGVRW